MLMLKLTLRILNKCSHGKNTHLLHKFYNSQDISQRVSALKLMTEDLSEFSIDNYQIKVPSYFKKTTAKELLQYHKINKTAPNINILHALAFIQFNAFQAYADTLLRFAYAKQGHQFRQMLSNDQLCSLKKQLKSVAVEEGEHCQLLSQRLKNLGYNFGEFPVISNLANVVELTKEDFLERLALISIVHEGRGIKSVPKLIHKVQACNDKQSALILRKIQSEETGHFLTGLKWFKYFLGKKISFPLSPQTQSHKISEQALQKIRQELEMINKKYKVNILPQEIKVQLEKDQ